MTASNRTNKRDAANTLAAVVAGFGNEHRHAHNLVKITDKLTEADLLELIEIVSDSRNKGRRDEAHALTAQGGTYFRTWALELQAAATAVLSLRDRTRQELQIAERRGIRPGPRSAAEALLAATIPPADRKVAGPTFQEDRRAGRGLLDAELADPLQPTPVPRTMQPAAEWAAGQLARARPKARRKA